MSGRSEASGRRGGLRAVSPLPGNEDHEFVDAAGDRWLREKGCPYVLDALIPYLAHRPLLWRVGDDGEWPAFCPLHEDARPSMSINFRKGVWCCYAGCGGGTVERLLESREGWIPKDEHPHFAASRK